MTFFDGTNKAVSPILIGDTALLSTVIYSGDIYSIIPVPQNNHTLYIQDKPFEYNGIENLLNIDWVVDTTEPIIPLKVVKKVKFKIKKPTPLKLISIQDSEGFYNDAL